MISRWLLGGEPTPTTIAPAYLPASGGLVTISGEGLSEVTRVTVGGTAAPFVIVSDYLITVAAPPHAAGSVDVVLYRSRNIIPNPGFEIAGSSSSVPQGWIPGDPLVSRRLAGDDVYVPHSGEWVAELDVGWGTLYWDASLVCTTVSADDFYMLTDDDPLDLWVRNMSLYDVSGVDEHHNAMCWLRGWAGGEQIAFVSWQIAGNFYPAIHTDYKLPDFPVREWMKVSIPAPARALLERAAMNGFAGSFDQVEIGLATHTDIGSNDAPVPFDVLFDDLRLGVSEPILTIPLAYRVARPISFVQT